jgi:hypothetical protein
MCEPITAAFSALASSATAAVGSMSVMQGISLGATVLGGISSSNAARQQGAIAQQVANNNATIAEYQATDAQRRAGEEALAVRRKASQLSGTQRATMAARGLDLTGGTPAQLLGETDFFGEQDQKTAKYNGDVEAWGRRAQAGNMRAEGAAAASAGRTNAFNTLLSTGGSVADKWYRYGGSSGSTPARLTAGLVS